MVVDPAMITAQQWYTKSFSANNVLLSFVLQVVKGFELLLGLHPHLSYKLCCSTQRL